jgi:hypothetical protein
VNSKNWSVFPFLFDRGYEFDHVVCCMPIILDKSGSPIMLKEQNCMDPV